MNTNQISDDDLIILTRGLAESLDKCTTEKGGEYMLILCANKATEILAKRGLEPRCHEGRDDLAGIEITEWYLGQLPDIAERKAFFAVNSWINCVDNFAPERKS